MIYTQEQIKELKALRLAYIARTLDADTYELEVAKINAAAKREVA